MDADSKSLAAVMDSKLVEQVIRIARTLHVAKRTEDDHDLHACQSLCCKRHRKPIRSFV